jgi:hypothetical protein
LYDKVDLLKDKILGYCFLRSLRSTRASPVTGITTFLIVNCPQGPLALNGELVIVIFFAVAAVKGNRDGLGLQPLFVQPFIQGLAKLGQLLPDFVLNLPCFILICHLKLSFKVE